MASNQYSEMPPATESAPFNGGFESALGRRWSRDDSMRILRRVNADIEINIARGGYSARRAVTTEEYNEALRCEIRLEIENINIRVSGDDLGQNSWINEDNIFVQISEVISDQHSGDPELLEILVDMEYLLFNEDYYILSDDEEVDDGLFVSEEKILNHLKITSWDEGITSSVEDAEMCCVCQENLYQENLLVATLGCRHEYHVGCIKEWLLRGNNMCPLCRAKAVQD